MKKQITIEEAERELLLMTTKEVVMDAIAELYHHTACAVMDEYEIVRPDGGICSVMDKDQWYFDQSVMDEFLKKVSHITTPKTKRAGRR